MKKHIFTTITLLSTILLSIYYRTSGANFVYIMGNVIISAFIIGLINMSIGIAINKSFVNYTGKSKILYTINVITAYIVVVFLGFMIIRTLYVNFELHITIIVLSLIIAYIFYRNSKNDDGLDSIILELVSIKSTVFIVIIAISLFFYSSDTVLYKTKYDKSFIVEQKSIFTLNVNKKVQDNSEVQKDVIPMHYEELNNSFAKYIMDNMKKNVPISVVEYNDKNGDYKILYEDQTIQKFNLLDVKNENLTNESKEYLNNKEKEFEYNNEVSKLSNND